MDRALFTALSRQQRMAVKLRASEKRILNLTIKAVTDELVKLPSVISTINENSEIVPAGRSFDALRNRPTVANARSASDWVDDKSAPKKIDSSVDKAGGSGGEASVVERRRRRRSGDK